ncbi:hypothetical protein [Ensifer sp. 1H6]|uniref:hypothetical protein n=1 Tax=Ensifer sp. 1H6 TaxID=1911585 RepID=UPI0009CFC3F2|nr:hypothetical protein [Ensifer sp. 1H6]OMQ42880.1 hypothetical protein BKP54_21640 [Ensifer sp. 1H6]
MLNKFFGQFGNPAKVEKSAHPMIKDIEVSPHMTKIRRSLVPGQPVLQKTARRGCEYQLISDERLPCKEDEL